MSDISTNELVIWFRKLVKHLWLRLLSLHFHSLAWHRCMSISIYCYIHFVTSHSDSISFHWRPEKNTHIFQFKLWISELDERENSQRKFYGLSPWICIVYNEHCTAPATLSYYAENPFNSNWNAHSHTKRLLLLALNNSNNKRPSWNAEREMNCTTKNQTHLHLLVLKVFSPLSWGGEEARALLLSFSKKFPP